MKKIFLTACLIFLYSLSHAWTLSELRTITRGYINDKNTENPHFTDATVDRFINIAMEEISLLTFCLESTTSFNLIHGAREYPLPADLFTVQRVALDYEPLKQRDIPELDDKSSGWAVPRSTSNPSFYYIKHTTYSVIGFDVLTSTRQYTTVNIQYIKIPTYLSSDSAVPFDNYARMRVYRHLISLYASALLCYQDNRPADGDRYYKLYADRVNEMGKTIRLTPNYYPSIGIGGGYSK